MVQKYDDTPETPIYVSDIFLTVVWQKANYL